MTKYEEAMLAIAVNNASVNVLMANLAVETSGCDSSYKAMCKSTLQESLDGNAKAVKEAFKEGDKL